MDFSKVELTEDEKAFQAEVREFLATHVTDEVRKHDRDTGDNFDIGVHRALAEKGWLGKARSRARKAGRRLFSRRIPDLASGTAQGRIPLGHLGNHRPDRIFGGDVRQNPNCAKRFCRASTTVTSGCAWATPEPDGGSDVATCKTRAVRDGDDWVINGSKMFTTGAHNCQYCFLITNTDPDARKHKSLTMFLVPLDTPASSRSSRCGRSTATAPTSSTTATSASPTSTGSARSTRAGPWCASRSTRNTAWSTP